MAGFDSQPDEGYSEDPLNHSGHPSSALLLIKGREDAVTALGSSRQGPEFPAWLIEHISGLPLSEKAELTMALLSDLPTSMISQIVHQQLNQRLYIDFVRYLPPEVCLKILEYLDPISLINFARASREWHNLALDRKLWQLLYYGEGWRAKTDTIRTWELKVNAESSSSATISEKQQPGEDGHAHKKRILSMSRGLDGDDDMMMIDADGTVKQEPADMEMTGSSIFGDPGTSSTVKRTGISQRMSDLDMRTAHALSPSQDRNINKGKGRASSPISATQPSLPKSSLWMWDDASRQFRINWKYLYTMRRRLESNWELGKYTNFQLPHPDHPEEGHGECIYTLQYNPDYLVSGSRDRTIKVWDMHTRRCLRTMAKHRGSVLCLQFDSDPEEDIIVSGSSDSNVVIWRFSTGQELQTLKDAHHESVLNVKFNKTILVTCSKDKTVKIFNRKPLRHGDLGYQEVDPVGRRINYGYNLNRTLEDLPETPPWTLIGTLEGHGAAVNAVQIHDREVVSASGDRQIKLWDWPTQTCTRTIIGHNKGIACVQYDGRRIVSGSSDAEVKIFDRRTGLEVATLRAHSLLVRTVQTGFGDTAFSEEEDAAEAKRVDMEYFKALAAGQVEEQDRADARRDRRRHVNAGSRRPQDICAYGATLPPGGGGGKYGRIVSGSYDTTIIIWRRDKEGIWKAQHHLKQEDAALAAAAARAETPRDANGSEARSGALGSATLTPAAVEYYRAIIEAAIGGGQQAFVRALDTYPQILSQRVFVETVIDSQPSPVVRGQLRQAFSAAMIRAQFEQARSRRQAMREQDNLATQSTATTAGPSNTATGTPAPAPAVPVAQGATAAAQMNAAAVVVAAATHQAHAQLDPRIHGAHLHQVPAPALPANAQPQAHRHHRHARVEGHNHANHVGRAFKLQFDARRIICCSQTSVILGWDFCNGDPALEEASRFFEAIQ